VAGIVYTARVTRYDVISIWEIDMGDGYGKSDRYGYLPYRCGHPGYRYGIWANDMGDESIDTVISHIDVGYLVTLDTALPQL
jgi:hypothetical protein